MNWRSLLEDTAVAAAVILVLILLAGVTMIVLAIGLDLMGVKDLHAWFGHCDDYYRDCDY